MIYTSYYANYRKFPGFITCSISRTIPRGVSIGVEMLPLAPSENLLSLFKKGKVTTDRYKEIYLIQLEKLHKSGKLDKVVDVLTELNNSGKHIVLLCYEKPPKFCHRFILSDYLNEHYNLGITEL